MYVCVHVAKLATRSAVDTFWARSYKLWWKSSLASIVFRFFPYGATINNNRHTTQRFAAQRCHDECRRQQFNQLHWGTVMSCSWCIESFAPAKIGSQLLVSLANHPTLKNSWETLPVTVRLISCHGLAMAWRHGHAPEGVPGSWHLWLRQNANYATFSSSDRLVSALNLYGKRTGDNFTRSRSKTQTCQTWRKNRNSRPR